MLKDKQTMLTYETTKTSPKSLFQFLSGLFSSGQLYLKHLAEVT